MKEFLIELLKIGLSAILKLLAAFGIGTAAGAIACLYYNIPLIFSLLGGILVLGFALALMSDSIFD